MNKLRDILSYPLIAFIYFLSYLPMWVLYGISSVLRFFLYHVFRYRRGIVMQNLRNSFPQKTEEELKVVAKKFYHHFADVLVEVIKLKTISFNELKRRCYYTPETVAMLDRFYQQERSIMIVLGHMGNWEWAGSAFPLYNQHQIITAYRPLRNKTFDSDTLKTRSRTGNMLASMKKIPAEMFRNRKKVIATALIADQTPAKGNAFWVRFLHQETPFFKGTEVLSQKFKTPLLWGSVKRVKRGYYHIHFDLITENPERFTEPGQLTCLHTSFLERDIHAQPESWLWSHRRWKHNRPVDTERVCEKSSVYDTDP